MKKLLSIVFCTAAIAAFGVDDLVLGEIGVTKILSTNKNTIVAISYTELGGGTTIAPSNLVKTANLLVGDQLKAYVMDSTGTNGTYETWTLVDHSGVLIWEGNAQTYSQQDANNQNSGSGADPDDFSMTVGSGIWLIRNGDDRNYNVPFYIYGTPVASASTTTVKGKWNLIGNPNQTDFNFTGNSGDKAMVPVSTGMRTYNRDGENWWYNSYTNATRNVKIGGVNTNITVAVMVKIHEGITLAPGTGIWYNPINENTIINWKSGN